jgi:hypothetical protein
MTCRFWGKADIHALDNEAETFVSVMASSMIWSPVNVPDFTVDAAPIVVVTSANQRERRPLLERPSHCLSLR